MATTKYGRIVRQLRDELARLEPGTRVASENQLAVRFNVSRPTAARALRELQEAGLVERRVGSGTFTLPAGDDHRRSARPAPATIGLMLAGLGATEVWDPIARHVTTAASARGVSVVVGPEQSPRDEVPAVTAQARWMVERGISGVLFAPLENVAERERENRAICEVFEAAGIPVILLDRDIVEFPGRSGHDVVGMDDVRAGAMVGEHLLARGLHRAIFLSLPNHPATTDLRSAGCRWALARDGANVPNTWHVSGDPSDDEWIAATLAEQTPRVVVCANDRTAALLIQTLGRLGRRVPHDVAVVGFDDVVYSRLLPVALTTVAQPFEQIAEAAVDRLLQRIAQPALPAVDLLLAARLMVRESTDSTA